MPLITAYRYFIIGLDWVLTHIYIRKFEVVGKENLPLEGPLIVASNHLNNADPPMIALATRPRFPMFMAKREMISWPILGPAFRIFGAFPVSRGKADLSALRAATEHLENGAMLVMFPEGTRSRTGGMGEAYPGTGIIAIRSGALILPVAITGSEKIGWPWIFLKPFSVPGIKVVIGKPFHLPEYERTNSETAVEATNIIMGRIAELLPPSYRGAYADTKPETEAISARTAEGIH
jgi:1-acyl-sn-glycerol-3-phosphate acyltransferase